MKLVSVETPEKSVCKMTFSASAEELEAASNAVYERTRATYTIKGFAKGEADRAQIEADRGEHTFWYDAINDLMDKDVPALYNAAMAEHGFHAVDEPVYDLVSVKKDEGFVATATTALQPELSLTQTTGFKTECVTPEVTDKEIDAVLERRRAMAAELVPHKGPAVKGNIVHIDYEGLLEGKPFNGGAAQMERPNTFIIQQGRAAESVLMEIVKKILAARHPGKVFTIPSNGHFDTTEGNIKQMGSIPRNLYHKELLYQVPEGGKYEKNPFKGNMDIEKLEQLITAVGPENVPLVFTCITKEAFPILRYRTRDIGVIHRGKCSCGRTFVRMSKPMGRTDDMLIIRGVNVFPSQIETVLIEQGYAPVYQIVVDRANNFDSIEVRVEISSEIFSDTVRDLAQRAKELSAALKNLLGIHAKVTLMEPNSLPRSEGKAVRVIDRRKLLD